VKKHNGHNGVARIALSVVRKFAPGVKKVSDADGDLVINVTDRDSRTSTKKAHGGCALAMAAKRQQGAAQVIISSSIAYVIKGTHATRYKVPEAAGREVVSFDRGAAFEAGDYVLKAPPKSMRLGSRAERANNGHGGDSYHNGNAAKRFIHKTANIRKNLRARA